jgi:hypothetical protein
MGDLKQLEGDEEAKGAPEAIGAAVTPVPVHDLAAATAPYNAQHALVERELVALLIERGDSTGKASELAHAVLQVESPLALFASDGRLNADRVAHALQALTASPQATAQPPKAAGVDPTYGSGLSVEDFATLPRERQIELRLRYANSLPPVKTAKKTVPPQMPDDIKNADALTRLRWINANAS